jgi:hypothetical protein
MISPNMSKILKKIKKNKGALLNLEQLSEEENTERSGSQFSDGINHTEDGHQDKYSNLNNNWDFNSNLHHNDEVFFGSILNKDQNLVIQPDNDIVSINKERVTKKMKKLKKQIKKEHVIKKKPNKQKSPKKTKKINKKKSKSLKMRRKQDKEYTTVVRSLNQCITHLQEDKNLFKLISKNPFKQLLKKSQNNKGKPGSNLMRRHVRIGAPVVTNRRQSTPGQSPNDDRVIPVLLLLRPFA